METVVETIESLKETVDVSLTGYLRRELMSYGDALLKDFGKLEELIAEMYERLEACDSYFLPEFKERCAELGVELYGQDGE